MQNITVMFPHNQFSYIRFYIHRKMMKVYNCFLWLYFVLVCLFTAQTGKITIYAFEYIA